MGDYAIVNHDRKIMFIFKNGTEVEKIGILTVFFVCGGRRGILLKLFYVVNSDRLW